MGLIDEKHNRAVPPLNFPIGYRVGGLVAAVNGDDTLISLTFASVCMIASEDLPGEVSTMVEAARYKNDLHDITGILLFTGDHFIQTLEGPTTLVDALMDRIERDPRHTEVTIVQRQESSGRRFLNWSMSHIKPSLYMSNAVAAALADAPDAVAKLAEILFLFSPPSPA